MKKTTLGLILSLILAVATSNASPAAKQYLIKYKNISAVNRIVGMQTDSFGLEMKDIHRPGRLVTVSISQGQEAKTIAALYADKNVEYVVPNFKIYAYNAPVDVNALREQYALKKVNAEQAWTRAGNKGNRKVLLAVIDTGVDYKHQNLAPNMVPGYDFHDNTSDPMDQTGAQNPGHGTHCAGIVGATGVIEGGTSGISPEVSIMPLRFLGADGSGDLNNAIKAIDYAIEHKVQVISASWGASVPRSTAQPLIEAIQRAENAGIIFVTAAANDGKNNDTTEVYPANSGTANMITVAASGATDAKPSWSNYGKAKVSLAAPGEGIISTLPGNKYDNLSGTSMATPLVAGMVAFLKAQDATLTGAEVRSLLQTTGAKVQIETACNCRVDAFAAVDMLLNKKAWIVPAAATIEEKGSVQLAMKNASGAVKFESSNPAVATVNDKGLLTAVTKGTVTVKATDAKGTTAQSLDINVGAVASSPGQPDPGNPGAPGDGSCPVQDPAMCQIICQIMPTAPFCK